MAHLAIDAVGNKCGGVATVLQAIVDAALESDEIERCTAFVSPKHMRDFDLPRTPRLQVVDIHDGERGLLSRFAWHHVGLAAQTARCGADALLLLGGGGRAPAGVRTTILVQQSLPMDPKALGLFPPSRRLRFLVIGLNTRLACARSDTVIVQTHTMQNWMSAAGVDAGRIVVIEPCATIGAPMNSLSSPPPAMLAVPQNRRWLYVGSTEPHKNVQVLLSALEVVRRSLPETTLFATIPPQHPWARAPGVCALGTVPASQLAAVYRAATVLVMPSLVETVGLPMIEAFSAGLPVVAASRPYARDVCRDAAVFFESGDVSGLAAALQMLMLHSDERNRWAQLGRARAHHLADSRPYHRLVRACLHGPEKVE